MTQTQTTEIALALIVPGTNDRTVFRAEEIAELAASLAEHGLAQPPTVRPIADGRFEIVCGERRTRAARHLGWETIPCMVRELDDRAASAIMLTENTARADLDPIDEARAYQSRMDAFGLSREEVAAWAGVSWQRVLTRVRLLSLVEEAQTLVRAGQLSGQAGLLMADLDSNRQRLALRAIADGMNASALAALCRRLKAEQSQDSMFDADSFLQVAEYVLTAEAASKKVTAATLRDLVSRMADELAAAGIGGELIAEAVAAGAAIPGAATVDAMAA